MDLMLQRWNVHIWKKTGEVKSGLSSSSLAFRNCYLGILEDMIILSLLPSFTLVWQKEHAQCEKCTSPLWHLIWGLNPAEKSNMQPISVTFTVASLFAWFPLVFRGRQLSYAYNSIMNLCTQDVRPGLHHRQQRISEGHLKCCRNDDINNTCSCCGSPLGLYFEKLLWERKP